MNRDAVLSCLTLVPQQQEVVARQRSNKRARRSEAASHPEEEPREVSFALGMAGGQEAEAGPVVEQQQRASAGARRASRAAQQQEEGVDLEPPVSVRGSRGRSGLAAAITPVAAVVEEHPPMPQGSAQPDSRSKSKHTPAVKTTPPPAPEQQQHAGAGSAGHSSRSTRSKGLAAAAPAAASTPATAAPPSSVQSPSRQQPETAAGQATPTLLPATGSGTAPRSRSQPRSGAEDPTGHEVAEAARAQQKPGAKALRKLGGGALRVRVDQDVAADQAEVEPEEASAAAPGKGPGFVGAPKGRPSSGRRTKATPDPKGDQGVVFGSQEMQLMANPMFEPRSSGRKRRTPPATQGPAFEEPAAKGPTPRSTRAASKGPPSATPPAALGSTPKSGQKRKAPEDVSGAAEAAPAVTAAAAVERPSPAKGRALLPPVVVSAAPAANGALAKKPRVDAVPKIKSLEAAEAARRDNERRENERRQVELLLSNQDAAPFIWRPPSNATFP